MDVILTVYLTGNVHSRILVHTNILLSIKFKFNFFFFIKTEQWKHTLKRIQLSVFHSNYDTL